ncbi:hypothetical protein HMPREF0476_1595 [Kingella kingae ATCC 23330]|uniref:Uncharacterized protein n=1 Tax=Kingella kingae ATCC 23330 TaxID=887327 RepID=F5S8R2_KINKI|nr:hypothetical protein HMPREF0476_1595 [Kingella kingae ATCC 23330]
MPTPLCTSCTRRSLSPCPSLNLIHYKLRWQKQPALICAD